MHGKAKLLHGEAKLLHGKAKLLHGKAKLLHGKAKLLHGTEGEVILGRAHGDGEKLAGGVSVHQVGRQ